MKKTADFIAFLLAGLLLFFIGFLVTGKNQVKVQRVEHVFIISLDGAGGFPELLEQRTNMPVFRQLADAGASTWAARTIFPSITLPSHTSMLTGVGPEKHKVLWNDWMPEKGVVKVPTVFDLAKRSGLTTAMFVGKVKFHHLDVPGTLNLFVLPEPKSGAAEVAAAFAGQVGRLKPNLCFIHFADPDTTGHKFGWGSAEQTAALGVCDQALKTVCQAIADAGLIETSVIILTADHGGHDKTHGLNIPEDMTIPWAAWGRGVKSGCKLRQPVTTYDTAATALWLLGVPAPVGWDGRAVREAFELDQ